MFYFSPFHSLPLWGGLGRGLCLPLNAQLLEVLEGKGRKIQQNCVKNSINLHI